jgi:hypothetical protein
MERGTFFAFLAASYPAFAEQIERAETACRARVASDQNVRSESVIIESLEPMGPLLGLHGHVKPQAGGTVGFTCTVRAADTLESEVLNLEYDRTVPMASSDNGIF